MRKFTALILVPVMAVLLAVAVLVARGGDGDTAARHGGSTSSEPSTGSTPTTGEPQRTTSTTAEPDVVAAAPVSPPAAPTPQPSGEPCDSAAIHDAIARSGGVADHAAFEVTYLECAEGYGWAEILADFGDGATVFFEASGGDITVLDLGTAVCPTAAGMPQAVAAQLAPPGSRWLDECA
jgi:hypothetical protein